MSHWIIRVSIALLPLCALASPATGQTNGADSTDAVVADCSGANLPRSTVDSCLERARVLDETSPSPQLQSLEAQLSRQAEGKGPTPLAEPSGPATQADRAPTAIGSTVQTYEPPPPPPPPPAEAYAPYRDSSGSNAGETERDDPSGMGGGEPPVRDPDSAPSSPDGSPDTGTQPNPQ